MTNFIAHVIHDALKLFGIGNLRSHQIQMAAQPTPRFFTRWALRRVVRARRLDANFFIVGKRAAEQLLNSASGRQRELIEPANQLFRHSVTSLYGLPQGTACRLFNLR
jgi:hypothetical protein